MKSFADAILAAGWEPPPDIQPGRFYRFGTNGKVHDRAGYCKLFPDGEAGIYGDWRTGEQVEWFAERSAPLSPAEASARKQQVQEARAQAEAELKRQHEQAAARAAEIWRELPPVQAHEYCKRKGIRPDGARIDKDGSIVLPVFDGKGVIQSLQFIGINGGKRFLPDAKMTGGRMYIGSPADGSPLILCEGWATGASLHDATGITVACGFSGSNLKHVAADICKQFAKSPLIVAGDLDAHGAGLRYAEAAKDAHKAATVLLPIFADGRAAGDFNDQAAAEGLEAAKHQIAAALSPPIRYKLMTDEELAALPPLKWRIKRVMPESGLAALFGPSGSGKSFLALDMLQTLAAGEDWFGYGSKPCNVVYVGLEGEAGIAGRVAAYRIRHGRTASSIRYLSQPFSLLEHGDIRALADAIQAAGGAGIVVLDTLNRAAPGSDENDSRSMGAILSATKELQNLIGGLVLVVHHTGKDATKGLRGHSSLLAALDAAIEVRRDGDRRDWVIAKSKDCIDGDSHPFKLEVVEVGTDEDGEPVTSCTVKPEQHTTETVKRVLPPKSGNQAIIWAALGEVFRKAGETRPTGAPETVPHGRPCITIEDAIAQTRARLVCDQKRQTERTQSAITGLINRGLLESQGGFLWCK